jgi:hypothetical protein
MGLLSKAAARTNSGSGRGTPNEPAPVPSKEEAPAGEIRARKGVSGGEEIQRIKEDLIQYQKKESPFQGIVLDTPGRGAGKGDRKFFDRLGNMILCFGVIVRLSAGRSLVLLPAVLDRELIAHRISRSLDTLALGTFGAADPEGAMQELQPFL